MKRLLVLTVILLAVLVHAVVFINPFGPTLFPIAGLLSREVKTEMALDIKLWRTLDEATAYIVSKR